MNQQLRHCTIICGSGCSGAHRAACRCHRWGSTLAVRRTVWPAPLPVPAAGTRPSRASATVRPFTCWAAVFHAQCLFVLLQPRVPAQPPRLLQQLAVAGAPIAVSVCGSRHLTVPNWAPTYGSMDWGLCIDALAAVGTLMAGWAALDPKKNSKCLENLDIPSLGALLALAFRSKKIPDGCDKLA
jgi:hypothetical protein